MSALLITKEADGYFSFVVDGNTAEKITNMRNDVLAIGTVCNFKTANGANIIQKQNIDVTEITLVASGTFTFSTVPSFLSKLIDVGYYDWLLGGGSGTGTDRFDELLDTFDYFGKDGQCVIVNESEQKLETTVLYNKRKIVDLEDTFSTIIPNKMLVTNAAGDKVELADLPTPPEQFLNAVGSFHYSDLATQTTPISVTSGVETKLTNDALGVYNDVSNAPYGVPTVWDATTNQFDFSSLSIGDLVHIRPDLLIDLVGTNTSYEIYMKFAIGTASEWTLSFSNAERKSTDSFKRNAYLGFDIGNSDTNTAPAEMWIKTDANATVKVNGWYVEVLRKNINIVDISVNPDINLDDLNDVDAPNPQQGASLIRQGAKWIAGTPTPAVGTASKFYLDITGSVADNFTLSTAPSAFPETINSKACTSGTSPVFFERFVSEALGVSEIPSGSWDFNLYLGASSVIGSNIVNYRMNKRVAQTGIIGDWSGTGTTRTFTVTSGGTPFAGLTTSGNRLTAPLIETPNQTAWVTVVNSNISVSVFPTDVAYVNETGVELSAIYYWLFGGNSPELDQTAVKLYTVTTVQPAFTGIGATDRLVLALFGSTDGNRTLSLYYGGNTNYTNFVSPLGDTASKLDKDGYTGTAQTLKDEIDAITTEYTTIVYVNSTDPSTATIFDDVNPPITNDPLLDNDVANLYIGTDSSTWVWNGSIYTTKVVPESSNFYVNGTTVDAGNNKNQPINREHPISVMEVGNKGISIWKHTISFWKYVTGISKTVNVFIDNVTNNYSVQFPNKAEAATETFAMVSDVDLKQDILTDVNFGTFENSLTAKSTPIDADLITIIDTADSNKAKKTTFTQLKAFLKTYWDTLYQVILVSGINIKTINGTTLLGSGDLTVGGAAVNTTNYIPKSNGSAFVDSQVFDNGTSVGIGMNNPTEILNIFTPGSAVSRMFFSENGSSSLGGGFSYDSVGDVMNIFTRNSSGTDFNMFTFPRGGVPRTTQGLALNSSVLYLSTGGDPFHQINYGGGINFIDNEGISFKLGNPASNISKFHPSGRLSILSTTDNGINALQVAGSGKFTSSVQVGDNVAAASAALKGVKRYREDANGSYNETCMQTSLGVYEWVSEVQFNW